MAAAAIAKQILSRTLALESAVAADQWSEAPVILKEREALLNALQEIGIDEEARSIIRTVRGIDDRLAERFAALRAAAAAELSRQSEASRRLKSFAHTGATGSALDRIG